MFPQKDNLKTVFDKSINPQAHSGQDFDEVKVYISSILSIQRKTSSSAFTTTGKAKLRCPSSVSIAASVLSPLADPWLSLTCNWQWGEWQHQDDKEKDLIV